MTSQININLAIDFILRDAQRGVDSHKILAYADDLILISETAPELQTKLNRVIYLASKISLKCNTKKFYTLHYKSPPPDGARNTIFYVNNECVPHLTDVHCGMFLSKPLGSFVFPDEKQCRDIKDFAVKILTSRLTPWQRIDALKTFFFPPILFNIRTAKYAKEEWEDLDKT